MRKFPLKSNLASLGFECRLTTSFSIEQSYHKQLDNLIVRTLALIYALIQVLCLISVNGSHMLHRWCWIGLRTRQFALLFYLSKCLRLHFVSVFSYLLAIY